MSLHIGIDAGSVSIKVALFSVDREDLPSLERLVTAAAFGPVHAVRVAHGRPGWISVAPYTRIVGNPMTQARLALERITSLIDREALASIAGTGSGVHLLEQALGVQRHNEFRALTRAIELLLPRVRTLFEIGGENSKYMRFERHGSDGQLGIADYQTNGDCAAGTGAFLDQQAGRLKFHVEQIGTAAQGARRAAQIAGRCSVFAKSDMVHAQQKGFAPEEILKGLCEAVARNFQGAITKGRPIVPDVAFVGGVAANSGVVRALEQVFGWESGSLVVPPQHASLGAIGAALLSHEQLQGGAGPAGTWVLRDGQKGSPAFSYAPPLSLDRVLLLRERMAVVPVDQIHAPSDAYLGIDVGSVSTNLVVIDDRSRVLKEIYLRTDARPIEAVAAGLRDIDRSLGERIRIRGVGTTGSGRELIAELIGADVVKDEITAHKTGSTFVDRSLLGLGVDTIFEIGGQDAKFIRLQDGVVVDFAMNEACAAGTGSFLEERARELGIRIEGEFADLALGSDAPIRLGERCTVFMERDVNDCVRLGAALPGIAAGLAYSVATNYINRVVRGRKVGDVVFFQGGTAYNDAVSAALSRILGKRIIVPPFNGVMGALGVALLARERAHAQRRPTAFRGFSLDQIDSETLEFTCCGCPNYCQMQRVTVQGQHTYWGDKCSVRYRRAARSARAPVIDDLVAYRRTLLLDEYVATHSDGPVVGLPFSMSTYDWAPFWFTVFRELGVRVLLSEPTTNHIIRLGLEATVSAPCFPIQVAHGHIRWLLENGVDFVFVPNNIAAPGDPRRRPSFFCPWHQTLPFVARAAPFIHEHRDKLISPTLWFNQGVRSVAAALRTALADVGVRRTAREAEAAVSRGFEALDSFRRSIVDAGRRATAVLERSREHGVVLLGRPYNIYDSGVNLDLAAKLRQYYGANVLGFDFLDLPPKEVARYDEEMFWSYGARLLAAAAFTRDRPNLHLIYVTNFKCGPDSYVKHYVSEASGRPFLSLQFDGHNNDAGLLTRCEAYLDSKGALN